MPSNPPWTIDELILALSLYFEHGALDDTDPLVVELSQIMNALPIDGEAYRDATFRNGNSVAMRLANYAHVDPAHEGAGLSSTGQRAREVFNAYADRRDDCHELARAIREGVRLNSLPATSDAEDEGAMEGRFLLKLHRQRERNRSKVRDKLKRVRQDDGELSCEVCGLSESSARSRFGELSGELFECHHTKPLSTLTTTTTTRLADLAVVCPTCHRAVHRIEPPIDVDTLRERVSAGP
jgi:5-methylcytosine-specific restriction enzyme A